MILLQEGLAGKPVNRKLKVSENFRQGRGAGALIPQQVSWQALRDTILRGTGVSSKDSYGEMPTGKTSQPGVLTKNLFQALLTAQICKASKITRDR